MCLFSARQLKAIPAPQLLHCECVCVSVCVWGSICTHVVMNDMCHMCCLSGMPGTSGLLNTGPAPIEMAYQ